MTTALTTPVRQLEPVSQRLTLTFTNNHPCGQYWYIEGWLECVHGMLISPDDVAARKSEARANAAVPGGGRG